MTMTWKPAEDRNPEVNRVTEAWLRKQRLEDGGVLHFKRAHEVELIVHGFSHEAGVPPPPPARYSSRGLVEALRRAGHEGFVATDGLPLSEA